MIETSSEIAALAAENSVRAMRAVRERTGLEYHAIAETFGVSTMTAYRAITGASWRHVK